MENKIKWQHDLTNEMKEGFKFLVRKKGKCKEYL